MLLLYRTFSYRKSKNFRSSISVRARVLSSSCPVRVFTADEGAISFSGLIFFNLVFDMIRILWQRGHREEAGIVRLFDSDSASCTYHAKGYRKISIIFRRKKLFLICITTWQWRISNTISEHSEIIYLFLYGPSKSIMFWDCLFHFDFFPYYYY